MSEGKLKVVLARSMTVGGVSNDGRYWVRTSDLFRVKEARYHCANRPRIYDHTMSVWESIAAFEHPVMFTIISSLQPPSWEDAAQPSPQEMASIGDGSV